MTEQPVYNDFFKGWFLPPLSTILTLIDTYYQTHTKGVALPLIVTMHASLKPQLEMAEGIMYREQEIRYRYTTYLASPEIFLIQGMTEKRKHLYASDGTEHTTSNG